MVAGGHLRQMEVWDPLFNEGADPIDFQKNVLDGNIPLHFPNSLLNPLMEVDISVKKLHLTQYQHTQIM